MSELPKGWTVTTLDAIALGVRNGISTNPNADSGQPILRISAVRPMLLNPSDVRYLEGQDPRWSDYSLRESDLLYTRYNGNVHYVGVCARVNAAIPALFPDKLIRVRVSPVADSRYVEKYSHSNRSREFIEDRVKSSAGQTGISGSDLKLLPIWLPPLNEQKRIVEKLESLQARSRRAKAALDEVPALLEKLRQSILAAAFRGDLTKEWREKNPNVEPASALLARIRVERRKKWEEAELAKMTAKGKKPTDDKWKAKYKEPEPVDTTDLPELPEGWCWASVEELSNVHEAAVYGIIQPGEHVEGGIPYIRPADISRSGEVSLAALNRTSREIADDYVRSELKAGDVVLSIVGTIGKVLIVGPELSGANITQSSARIRTEYVAPYLVARLLQSPLLTNQFDRMRFGNAVQRLNVEHVRALVFPVPPAGEQSAIEALLKAQETRWGLSSLSVARAHLIDLDRSLLAKAFRGELVPQDPNDEPADVMLARVKAGAGDVAPKGRGRPARTTLATETVDAGEPAAPKKRGRPKKG